MSTFGYRRELSKYEELDEDELLASLTAEELQELEKELVDIEPDDKVPIGLRQRDQTVKTPTGTFSREALLKFWEKETQQILENERMGSSSPQGAETNEKENRTEDTSEESEDEDEEGEKEIESCVVDDDDDEEEVDNEISEPEEPITEEEDEEEEEKEVKEVKEKQENNLKKESVQEKCVPLHNGHSSLKPEYPVRRHSPQESTQLSGNPTVLDEALEKILCDDPDTTEVNLNNIDNISQETLIRFAEALRSNTHVRAFSLANTHADDPVAFAIAKMLKENCHITNINIESNYITGKGILALVQVLTNNNTLMELRFHNQRHICGGQVEMEMVKLLRENTTLLKLGYQFDLPGPRMSMTGILTRNMDFQRQKRMQELRLQQGGASTPINPRTGALQRSTPTPSPYGSPRSSPWSSPKLPRNDAIKRPPQPCLPPPPPPPPLPPPPPPPLPPKSQSITKKGGPTRMIAEVIKLQEASAKKQQNQGKGKCKSKKGKKGVPKDSGTENILKELKNALRPITDRDSSRPSTPMRSAHDELMASIRASSIKSLKRVEVPKYLR